MPTLPTPIRAALGLAATAVDEARKLPETLPQAVTTVPMIAMSTAMQASLRMQQHIATLAARGDEVLTRLRGTSSEAPSWATFDDELSAPTDDEAAPKAAFDTIDYEHTGFSEGDDGPARWDAVGVCDDETAAKPAKRTKPSELRQPPVVAPKAAAPKKATRKRTTTLAEDLAAEAAQPDE
jgi:hypothetical protein